MDELRAISTFVRVAELGSFNKVAAAQGVTQQAVGKTIRQLEQHLGNVLFASQVIGRRLFAVQQITCAAPAYLCAHGLPTTLYALGGHRCTPPDRRHGGQPARQFGFPAVGAGAQNKSQRLVVSHTRLAA
jgi:DNA-binding transcriptional LysR family regulator